MSLLTAKVTECTFDTKSTKSGADCDAARTRQEVRGTLIASSCHIKWHVGSHDRPAQSQADL